MPSSGLQHLIFLDFPVVKKCQPFLVLFSSWNHNGVISNLLNKTIIGTELLSVHFCLFELLFLNIKQNFDVRVELDCPINRFPSEFNTPFHFLLLFLISFSLLTSHYFFSEGLHLLDLILNNAQAWSYFIIFWIFLDIEPFNDLHLQRLNEVSIFEVRIEFTKHPKYFSEFAQSSYEVLQLQLSFFSKTTGRLQRIQCDFDLADQVALAVELFDVLAFLVTQPLAELSFEVQNEFGKSESPLCNSRLMSLCLLVQIR